MELTGQYFTFDEICCVTDMPSQIMIEMVHHGIIEPKGSGPESWQFNIQMATVTKKAYRLHRDLETDWSGIALAISLLDQLDQLRDENHHLRRRLERFTGQR